MSYIGNEPLSVAFLVDTFSGNGSTVAFTMSVAPANTSSILVAVTGVVQNPSTYSVSGTTLTFSAAPPTGTSNISVRYLGIPASGVTTTAYRTVTDSTATAGQTTFTIPSYTVGYVDVFRNGVRLAAADFTATTGTTIVLASGASAGDTITTVSFYVSSVLNAIQQYNGLSVNQSLTTPTVSTTMGVGGAAPSSSGSGITFPAIQSASSNANTLDDYSEGVWTPTLGGTGADPTGVTYDSGAIGYYTKIGRQVTVNFFFGFSTYTGGSGTVTVKGLPFTVGSFNSAFNGAVQLERFVLSASYTWSTIRATGGASYLDLQQMGSNLSWSGMTYASNVTSSATFKYVCGTVTYFV